MTRSPTTNLPSDHVVEASLEVSSGQTVTAGCTDYFPDAMRIPVPPALYRVRMSYGGLDTLSDDGLEGGNHYRLQLWPTTSIAVCVLKQHPK